MSAAQWRTSRGVEGVREARPIVEGVALRSAGLARLRCQCKNMQLITIKKRQKFALSSSLFLTSSLSLPLRLSLSLSHFLPNLCVKWVWPEVRVDKFFNTLPRGAHSGQIKINMPQKRVKNKRGARRNSKKKRERE